MMTGFGIGFGWIGLLLTLLFWSGLILLGVWLVREVFKSTSGSHFQFRGDPTARQILDQRYARGEISQEEYEAMKHDLG